jgi:hypothetical protein
LQLSFHRFVVGVVVRLRELRRDLLELELGLKAAQYVRALAVLERRMVLEFDQQG